MKNFTIHDLAFLLRVNKKYVLKLFLYFLLIVWISWNFLGINTLYYKYRYGKPIKQVLTVWDKEQNFNYDSPLEEDNFNGYPVLRSFKKKYALSGTLVYHDDNTSFWKKHFWTGGDDVWKAYNRIASHDLTIVWGKMARKENLKNIKITHELNGVMYECRDCYISDDESNNFHIIPANKNLDKALSVLPTSKKVPIYVEGYLTNWYGIGHYQNLRMETALDASTISSQKIGGQRTGLCYQLYLTKFIYDGYVFE